jgi:molybdopterin synthase sulfur carrier subunit
MIRVVLPYHLQTLARAGKEVQVQIEGPPTLAALLDALEVQYPVLRGTLRDHVTKERRAFIRFFACGEDLSLEPAEAPLPEAVVRGLEPFRVVGALAGG